MGNRELKKWLFTLFTLLLFISNSGLYGQQGNLLFHHLKLEDGLGESTNEYVYKDTRGFVWISSINGVNRFDGTRVKRFLPDQDDSTSIYGQIVQSNFFEDASSNIWFSTWEAVNGYDRKHDNFYHFFLRDSLGPVLNYAVFHIDSLQQLWILVENQTIYTFNTITKKAKRIVHLQLNSQRVSVISDATTAVQKIFAYAINSPGIEEVDFDQNGNVTHDQVLWTGKEGMAIKPRKVITEGDSVLWIAGLDELVKYNLNTNRIRRLRVDGLLAIEHYNGSMLLVSVDGQGVREFDKASMTYGYQYVPEHDNSVSLLTNSVTYISKDRDRGFWFCSTGFGISYGYDGKRKFNLFNPISIRDTENANFNPNGFIIKSPDSIICSTEGGGLFILDRDCRIIKKITGEDNRTKARLTSINKIFQDKKKNIWLSTYTGVSIIPDPFGSVHHVSDDLVATLDGIELADGRLLFTGYTGGFFEAVAEEDNYTMHQIKPDRFNQGYVPIRQDKKGRIWINENLQKFLILDPSTFDVIAEIPLTGYCGSFLETRDGNTIWITSEAGLFNIDSRDLSLRKFYNEKNGIPSPGLNGMLMDQDGKLWIGSANGLIVFNPETDSSQIYNYEDGLPSSNFNRFGALQFDDGEMWFASPRGITKFYPDKIKDITIQAIPQITALLINGKSPVHPLMCETTQCTNITEVEKLIFTYKQNTLTFILNALEYSAAKRNKVKYKMENFDADWEETASGQEVRYHLPQGSYTLLVKAANSDGVYSNMVRRLDLTITPPFYKTIWFMSLVALAILGLAVYIVYLNFSKKLELQKVRLRLYENLHDDVGSRLTAILLSAEELIHQDQVKHPKLEQIAKVAKSIVGNMRRLVWAIDPENDSMNSLVQKIRYDKSLILDEKIECHIELDSHLRQLIVPGEIRYQITSIINEALNNISKYAHAHAVWIEFSKKENYLHLVIRDDGVGFNSEEAHNDKVRSSGYGLGNMQKRVTRVKGNLTIKSKPGEGTRIEVNIPIS